MAGNFTVSRRLVRIGLVQIFFAMENRGEFSADVAEYFFAVERDEEEADLLYSLLFSEKAQRLRDKSTTLPFNEDEVEYMREAVAIYLDHKDEIDGRIAENLREWTLSRLATVDLSILRVAVFEILYQDDIDPAISINEAVNIAKIYSTEDSARFINGILGSVVREGKA
ncbi:N utilization substance protein B homolog [Aedoeadaptatus ivorii]|uniref:Transcription antitermination protein NusB n=1 Tax=Aedoeadaptatus ivorii TaxID=54006 RepID=A0A3S4Z3P6_9FIRM|nr:transcription antitermination factor NusB [Peptoniphilus ivorii]VEJ35533.1 N utilization substance protein B homolog [Peptoniphilus ivorii]